MPAWGVPKRHSLQFTSSITQDSTLKGFVEKHFIENKEIRILDRANSGGAPYDKVEGFIIQLYGMGTERLGQASTATGVQTSKSFFKPIKVEKGSVAGFDYYDLVFDLRCDLYKFRQQEQKQVLFGVLEGKYYTRIWI